MRALARSQTLMVRSAEGASRTMRPVTRLTWCSAKGNSRPAGATVSPLPSRQERLEGGHRLGERIRSPNKWLSWSIRRVSSSGGNLRSFREIATASAGNAQISRADLARLGFDVARLDDGIDEAGRAGVLGVERAAHHQHRKRALMSQGARRQQAGGAFRHQAEMDERRREGALCCEAERSRNGTASLCRCRSRCRRPRR